MNKNKLKFTYFPAPAIKEALAILPARATLLALSLSLSLSRLRAIRSKWLPLPKLKLADIPRDTSPILGLTPL